MAHGDTPYVVYGEQSDYKRLYYSDPEAALKVPITLMAGYGKIEQGTTIAQNLSAAGGDGKHVPYAATTFPADVDNARAYLVADSGTTATILYVSIDDSYKFAVGDDVIINDNTTGAENLGAITAIDRTTQTFRAAITVTTATGGTSFTTARYAHILVEAGTAGNNYSDCVGILEKTVNTGTGENCQGAIATLIIGNCVLYTGTLTNLDAAAITDISAGSYGQYTYIR